MFLDLLMGVRLSLAVGVVVILINNYRNSQFLHMEGSDMEKKSLRSFWQRKSVFLNTGTILEELEQLLENSHLELDVRRTGVLNDDVLEILNEFAIKVRHLNSNFKTSNRKRSF